MVIFVQIVYVYLIAPVYACVDIDDGKGGVCGLDNADVCHLEAAAVFIVLRLLS